MSKFLRSFIVLFALLWTSNLVLAQSVVKGTITSKEDGTTLPGVSILVKGTTVGTVTDKDGKYSIAVNNNAAVLVISSIGFVKTEVPVNGKSTLNITLESDAQLLGEVMVVGYGTVNKATHVGSSAQITSLDISKRAQANPLNALVGAAPGVQTTMAGGAPGSAPAIRIRGFGSISSSNSALYVVDGVPFDASTVTLNPDDIETISVLKDASTTAIYGSRGANGVVMITTKKGKEGRSNFTVNASAGTISRGLPEYETVNAQQYYPLMWEAYRNNLVYGAAKIPLADAGGIASGLTTSYGGKTYTGIADLLIYNPFNVAKNQIVDANGVLNPNAQLLYPDDLSWAKAIQRGGQNRQNYSINYDGGTSKTAHFASFGYTKEQGYLLKSDLERFTGRVSVDQQATKWLKAGINLSGSYSRANVDAGSDGGTSFINPFYFSRYAGPIYPIYKHDPTTGAYVLDANGNKIYDQGDTRPYSSGRHAVWENELNARKQIRGTVGARTYATVNILPGLKATTNLSFDLQDTHYRTYDNPIIGDGAPAGRAYHYLYRTTSSTFNQLLEYDKTINKHHFNVLGGHENYYYTYNYEVGARSGIIVDGITELPNFATVLNVSSYEDNYRIESFFSRASYDYDKKYILNASLRRDGNSRFAPGVRWANFWSLGGAYNIEREDFFNLPSVDLLKIRASYGVVGSDGILNSGGSQNYYPYQALYNLGRNNNAEPGFTQATIANEGLTWETSKNFDLGVDFSLYKGRISGSLEYFNRATTGLIFSVPLPLSSGGTLSGGFSVNKNIGNLYNRGIELQLTGDIIRRGDFTYSATLNWTTFKNQITKMPDSQQLIQSGTKAYSVGHSIYDFYLREFYGVDKETGAALYRTNAMTTNARVIGSDTVTTVVSEANYRYTPYSSIPKFYGSMNHNLTYKNFTLGFQFTYQVGGKVYDGVYASLMHGGSYGTALHVDALNRWQKQGDVADVPRLDAGNVANLAGGSTRWLTDASYLQFTNVSFTYKLPVSVLGAINAKEASVFFTGDNLALFSARRGMNVSGTFNGTTDNTYNFNRVLSLGARIRF